MSRLFPAAMVELVLLVRLEVLRLARTPEIIRYLLLPALLGLPAALFLVVVVTSARGPRATIAVPADLPAVLDLEQRLEDAGLGVYVRADPRAAWEAGEVDAAVAGWSDGDGIGAATRLEHAVRARWTLDLLVDDVDVAELIEGAARRAGADVLEDLVALSGGDADRDVTVAKLDVVKPEASLPFSLSSGLAAYAIFALSLVAFFFLALPQVADRREGVTETLRVLPMPMRRVLWARLLALWLLQLLVGLLVAANVELLLASALSGLALPTPGVWELIVIAASTLAGSAGYIVVGVLSPNAKAANNASSVVMTTQTGLLLWALFGTPPAFVPVAGALVATTLPARLVSLLATLGLAHALVVAAAALLERYIRLVLRRGDE